MQNTNYRIITPLILALAWAQLEAQTAHAVPKLVVNVTIDQLRTDYMEAFSSLYGNDGFNKILRDGRSYLNASYPFAQIDRASAMACIASGSVPHDNGIVGQRWMDRSTLRPTYCVDDASVQGWMTSEKYSPKALNVSTISDELKVATSGQALVYGIAPNADEAILSVGHAADGAFWIDNASGEWCSSSYYGQFPDWVVQYNASGRLSSRISQATWKPLSPIVGNFNFFITPQEGKEFKHKFTGTNRNAEFKTSACVNDEMNRFARHCITTTRLGKDRITDYLALTYYAGTFNNQAVSQVPIELQDTYVRLDLKLAELIKMLEKEVGAGQFLVVVTSTGYAPDELADFTKYRIPTGTFSITRASALLNMYLMAVYGEGRYIETEFDSQLFLNQKLIEDKQLNYSEVLSRSQAFLTQMAGVKDVFTSERLAFSAGMPTMSRLRNSFNQMRSGDIYIQAAPGWTIVNEQTHEQRLERASYVGFPIFFYGNNVRTELVKTPVTVDCIAPTVAQFMRIRAPNACSTAPLAAVK